MWKEDLYYCREAIDPESALTLTMAGITYCDGTYRVIRENSSFCLFEYIIEGEGAVSVGSRSYTPRRGDIYILHSGSSYEYYSSAERPWTKIWFTLTGRLINHLVQVYDLAGVHHLENTELRPFFDKFLDALKFGKPADREEIPLLFHRFLIRAASVVEKTGRQYSATALAIRNYLESRIEEKVSLEDISKEFYKSPSQVIRIFKNDFETTPYEYLLNLRIETAKHLLHNSNYSVKEIALKLQFADEHYFSNFFKARTGMPPSQYRQTGPVRYV